MADAELKVRIEAEMAGLAKGLNASVKLVDNAGSQISKSVQGLSTSFKTLNNTKFTFGQNYISASKSLATEAQKTGAALGGSMTVGSNRAAFALTNLGRVAQDAPFGFMGIQNNLNPLLESFQMLRKETGSNVSAFKALAGGLVGPAGLGLALSLVSAGILLYQEYTRKANKETRVMADANKELADSIKDIAGVQAEGRANASKDLSQLQSLYNATQNVNIPAKERLRIANDLIKRYPEYLKGFNAEEILAGKAAASYTKLTNAILAKGYAQAAEENRQKLINQQLNAKVELIKEQSKLEIAAAELLKRTTQKQATLDIQGQAALENGINRVSDAVDQSKGKINELNKVYSDSAKEIKILDDVTQGLIKTYGASVVIDPAKTLGASIGESAKEEKRRFFATINDFKGITEQGKKDIAKSLTTGKPLIDIDTLIGGASFMPDNLGKQLYTPFQILKDDIQYDLLPQLGTSFKSFFDDMLMNGKFSFQSLGESIKNTFLSVLASEATQALLNLLGSKGGVSGGGSGGKLQKGASILGGLAKLIGIGGAGAAAGVAAAGSLAGVAASTGGVILGSGVAAAGTAGLGTVGAATAGTVASGGLLLPILGGIAAAAGIASLFKKKKVEPQPAFTTSNAVSSYQTSSIASGSGTVVFEISGTNLVGVLNRAGAKLQRFGP